MNAVILFVSVCVAYVSAESGGYEPLFPRAQVESVEELLRKVASEKLFLKDRIVAIKGDKTDNIKQLQKFVDEVIPGFNTVNDGQNAKLEGIALQLKDLYHRFGPLSGELNAQQRVIELQISQLDPLRVRVNTLSKVNSDQGASLNAAEAALNQAAANVNEKLESATESANMVIDSLLRNTDLNGQLVDNRRCFNQFVEVPIDSSTFEGNAKVNFTEGFFSGNIPSTACFVQGFVSNINLGQSKPTYGYGPPADSPSTVDFAVDCLGGVDGVYVRVFDKSQGEGNSVAKVYVETKSCTLPAVNGPILH